VPQVVNVVVGGKTPVLSQKDLSAMGFGLVLYANVALQGAIAGMQQALAHLKHDGRVEETNAYVATFAERQRLVNKSFYEELDNKYSGKS
jgi:2-methylisocitrate lyase-like PEP mutase family enzyme